MRPCWMTMRDATRIMQITRHSLEWHERFFTHAAEAFDGLDFRPWAELGGWTNRYDVLALVSRDEILSTVARTRMVLSLADANASTNSGLRTLREGLQLGAIATRKDQQGKGYARRLMQQVLGDADRANLPVLLFSSEEAVTFYPKFGFQQVETSHCHAEIDVEPDTSDSPYRLDPRSAEDRRLLMHAVSASSSHRGGLSARPDGTIIIWFLFNTPLQAVSLNGGETVVLIEEEPDTLIIRDWLGLRPPDFRSHLPRLITRPVKRIQFGFMPPESWMGADIAERTHAGELMFLRGFGPINGPLCFPDMLHT